MEVILLMGVVKADPFHWSISFIGMVKADMVYIYLKLT